MYSRHLRHLIFSEVSGGKKKENWQGEVTEEFLLITNRSPYNNGGRIIISSTNNGFFKAQHLKTQGGGSVQTPSLILATSLSFGDVLISFKGLQFMLIMLLWQNSPEMPSKNRASMRSIHLKKGFLIASNIACKHSTLSTI